MAKFMVENLTDKTVSVGIEPWAEVEILAPDEKIEFEYAEPADEITFALTSDGGAIVGIISDRIRVFAKGIEKIIVGD